MRPFDGAVNILVSHGGVAGRPDAPYLLFINNIYAMLLEFILLQQVDARSILNILNDNT